MKTLASLLGIIFLTLLIAFFIMLVSHEAEAQVGDDIEVEDIESETESYKNYICGQTLAEEAAPLIENYRNFLDIQSRDIRPASDRLDEIMTYYRYVSYSLENIYEESIAQDRANDTFNAASDKQEYCASIRDQYLLLASSMLRTYIISSSASKSTFVATDGMKAINEGLKDMSQSFQATFPNMFNKFNNSFSCYINSCVGQ